MWLVTTLEQTAPEILWEMMNRRWDIEENGFHQLKTYYHAKHCYGHAAVEVVLQHLQLDIIRSSEMKRLIVVTDDQFFIAIQYT